MAVNSTLKIVALASLCLGVFQMGAGGYIMAKADLADFLLESAWADRVVQRKIIKPWPWADTWPVAKLKIPNLGIDQIILNDATGRTLAFAPGWLLASAKPGQLGNTVISGHRDTHFRFMQDLQDGMTIELVDEQRKTHRYQVSGRRIADIRHDQIQLDSDEHQLLLVTCWPLDAIRAGGPKRLVVTATPI